MIWDFEVLQALNQESVTILKTLTAFNKSRNAKI